MIIPVGRSEVRKSLAGIDRLEEALGSSIKDIGIGWVCPKRRVIERSLNLRSLRVDLCPRLP
jgi:hypothetical protein